MGSENFVRVFLGQDDERQLAHIEPDDYVEFVGTVNGIEIPVRFYRADELDGDGDGDSVSWRQTACRKCGHDIEGDENDPDGGALQLATEPQP